MAEVEVIAEAVEGLATALKGIPGLRVIEHLPDSIPETPIAIIALERRNANNAGIGMGSTSSFTGSFVVTLLVSKGLTKEAFKSLYAYIEPVGDKSVEAAIDADNTLGGMVDDARLQSVENIGIREPATGGRYVGADFRVGFIKQVLT